MKHKTLDRKLENMSQEDLKYIKDEIAKKLKASKPKQKSYQITKEDHLNDEEWLQMNKNLMILLDENPSKYLPILLAVETGARRSEVIKMKCSAVDLKAKTIMIYATKNSWDREIPLHDYVMAFLKDHIKKNNLKPDDQLFKTSPATMFRRWDDVRQGATHKKLHSLRHTFAINVFKAHKELRLVQIALGHKNIQNTMVYMKYVYDMDELKKLLLDDNKSGMVA